ncbi:aldehyde dehydrogenase family protein [Streptomyces sp. 061-3]|uniref:aldehyde dehydrogenase family protein n=1 Tax=Streptomyces sp. 061-3 TaxID=2789268 RepID=UPI00397FDABB
MACHSTLRLNFIDGQWVPAESGLVRENVNPADFADVIGEFTESGGVDVDQAVDTAAAALPSWRRFGPIERAAHLTAAGRILGARPAEVAAVITREQGKLLSEARPEGAGRGGLGVWVVGARLPL